MSSLSAAHLKKANNCLVNAWLPCPATLPWSVNYRCVAIPSSPAAQTVLFEFGLYRITKPSIDSQLMTIASRVYSSAIYESSVEAATDE